MKNPLVEKVNFYVSIFFIGSFGLLMVTVVLHLSQMNNIVDGWSVNSTADFE